MKYIITKPQFNLLVEGKPKLISEGRREELTNKYERKFKEYPEVLSSVIENEFISKTKYKYADFLLKNLHPNSSSEEIADAIKLIEDFDKFSKNLTKKDINQYDSLEELDGVITPYLASRDPESDAEKIYEDDRLLVVVPKNEEASCKYGANTKWCVTSKGSGQFDRYTSGNQILYFIIDKKNSTNKEYSKVAVHIDNRKKYTYYDTKDTVMSDREIGLLEYAFPEMMKAISDHYTKLAGEKSYVMLDKVFDNNIWGAESFESEYIDTNSFYYEIMVMGFNQTTEVNEEIQKAAGTVRVFLASEPYYRTPVDQYSLTIYYTETKLPYFEITIELERKLVPDIIKDGHVVDCEMDGDSFKIAFLKEETAKDTAKVIRKTIAYTLQDNLYIKVKSRLSDMAKVIFREEDEDD